MNDNIQRELVQRTPWTCEEIQAHLQQHPSLNPMQVRQLVTLANDGWTPARAFAQIRPAR
ncbi:hypothetical protein M8445_16935 (plasmid) [Deinococcus aquaticus]|uniref:Uncharacterized protein n=1 Tax=Deinococcus aquaticus TaxID=328692 RepID=A0ABY7V8P0_9DEIO|nr:hypothetical protein [Deinococcus aquaticus]WDA60652.1 hypothetical protein M8445_16935 [Deinococcus aquaticus]